MDQSEKSSQTQKEIGFYYPVMPFNQAIEGASGKIRSECIHLSGTGDLTFYASPNVGQIDTSKLFKDPRKVWVELSLPEDTPPEEVENMAMRIEVSVEVRNNQTIYLNAEIEGPKIIFGVRETYLLSSHKTTTITNPLIEDKERLPGMVFEFTDALDETLKPMNS
ncbi:MAG: hypothetical protein Q8P25_03220 [Candidatus Curtissbacteria bacterium]|nr:hypothetical protein [Candidatus Curtissbacteria bacterium]MDZ4209949.1 hypothetical protein [Candidatus Curtissbacteria bacterium]